MKTEMVFKIENKPVGFTQSFAQNCKVRIEKTKGLIYLNYEHRTERIAGSFENLRQEGELILADITLSEAVKSVEHRISFSIEGSVLNMNSNDEVDHISIKGVSALMPSLF